MTKGGLIMKKWIVSPLVLFSSFVLILLSSGTALAKPNAASCVTLYEHINYKGRHITLCQDAKRLSKYKFNDIASSVKVSKSGKGVTIYEHKNFGGKWLDLAPGRNIANFKQVKGLNDNISSVNIY
jgi:hypothetical protein